MQAETWEIPLKQKKEALFVVWMTKHWIKLPRQTVQSQFLDLFKAQLDIILASLL